MSDDDEEPGPTEQPTVDAASPATLRKARRTKRSQEREAAEFWDAVFSSEVGRREMWKLLANAHPFETKIGSSPAGFPDERASWIYHGEQQLGLAVFLNWQHHYPDGVRLMLSENDSRFTKRGRNG